MTDRTDDPDLLALYTTLAEQRGVSITAVQALSVADMHVEVILLRAIAALERLAHNDTRPGKEPAAVLRQTIAHLEALSPLTLHQAVETKLEQFLDNPEPTR
ncbi:hypothetical protein [Actinophytocola oryzae]|uniref:Uncharacterized protein n=1 Tax=Actinophytocola oryzae TaxID=502181 RepID=A0A4R7UTY9_9PSEU|nr:hypothetical protein [Actinophytocola oryzae]TDV40109.1 hypothetical protein CLV71_124128 [Actinophytocola oryzae]